MATDSVEIDTVCKAEQPVTLKSVIILYLLFLFVCSDAFVNSILSKFVGAVNEREPTNVGIMVMGIFLVIGVIVGQYLVKNEVL
jgi:hypothetical protein